MIKVLSYLAFTMLSLLIQFGVMDYIQAKIDKNAPHKDLNLTSPNHRFSDILKAYSNKSHALYYQTNLAKFTDAKVKIKSSSPVYMNVTLASPADGDVLTTTGAYDILLFDDNTTATEVSSTSESSFYTTTDFENITELSIFNNKNNETAKPIEAPKKRLREEDCYCDLLYQVCDINCCCDGDCLETDHKMFDCMEKGKNLSHDVNFCPFQGHSIFYTDNLFCVAHANLPEKRKITYEEVSIYSIQT
ncbi:uncharacterized protein LOC105386144 isoform X1 [Plutella xylostella]|uniref:uncharacterized protein LOC105386144 isoform X1 n=1 Tax=Plutella xylostella TaxID=51655 RepID=UPI0020329587|nr:uncharacterized protein LOC105386144 isoform X1 [Plutella xylostella]